jgi:hypothetical protein
VLGEAEVRAYLDELEFLPGWTFAYRLGRWEGPHLTVGAKVPNAYHPDELVALDIHVPLPPHALRSRADLDEFICWRLTRIASHEVREWLRRGGRPVFDPHADGADRDL